VPKGVKTGGRVAGTPNKTTAAIKDAIMCVYNDLQSETGATHGHFFGWAHENPTEFYKLAARLIPVQTEHTGKDGGAIEIANRIELIGVVPGEG